jgi:hypothetical protein
MSAPRELAQLLADEATARRRAYVLWSTRARWVLVALGTLLLSGVRLAGIVPIPWAFIAVAMSGFALANAGWHTSPAPAIGPGIRRRTSPSASP